jgi:hypothetical protein
VTLFQGLWKTAPGRAIDPAFGASLKELGEKNLEFSKKWTANRAWMSHHYPEIRTAVFELVSLSEKVVFAWNDFVLRPAVGEDVRRLIHSHRLQQTRQAEVLNELNSIVVEGVSSDRTLRQVLLNTERFRAEVVAAFASNETGTSFEAAAKVADAEDLAARVRAVGNAIRTDVDSAGAQIELVGVRSQAILTRRLELLSVILIILTAALIAITVYNSRTSLGL